MKKEIIWTDKAAQAISPISQATRFGNLVFTSGFGARDPKTAKFEGGDIKQQVRVCIENIKAVLEAAGTSLDNVLKATIHLRNMDRDRTAFNEVWAEYFKKDFPARATIGTPGLAIQAGDVEMEMIACIPDE